MSKSQITPTPSEIDNWLEKSIEKTEKQFKAFNPYYYQKEISKWINNTINKETEEIFQFLTEEKNKFLSKHNSTTTNINIDPTKHNPFYTKHNTPSTTFLESRQNQTTSEEKRFSEASSEKDSLCSTISTLPNPDQNITIASHNIRGITRTIDQEIFLENIYQKNIKIMGLNKTKLIISN